jgi:DNA polymerase-4
MAHLFRHALLYSPLVEMTDHNGHLFVDATGTEKLFGPAPDVAWKIRKAVRADMRFDPIWSVAPNKLLAKVATRMVKPTGEYIVSLGDEEDFLKPLPLHLIPGIERDDLKRLLEFNLTCAGHVADLSSEQLYLIFGNHGFGIYDAVRGIDPSPVSSVGQQPPRIIIDHDFGNDTNDVPVMEGALYQLVEKAGADLRQRRLTAKRVNIVLDYSDGKRVTRYAAAHPATANDLRLFDTARLALERAWKRRTRIRHIRLICDRLTYPPAQIGLFPEHEEEKKARNNLMTALDAVRRRFGFNAIGVGRTLSPNVS